MTKLTGLDFRDFSSQNCWSISTLFDVLRQLDCIIAFCKQTVEGQKADMETNAEKIQRHLSTYVSKNKKWIWYLWFLTIVIMYYVDYIYKFYCCFGDLWTIFYSWKHFRYSSCELPVHFIQLWTLFYTVVNYMYIYDNKVKNCILQSFELFYMVKKVYLSYYYVFLYKNHIIGISCWSFSWSFKIIIFTIILVLLLIHTWCCRQVVRYKFTMPLPKNTTWYLAI